MFFVNYCFGNISYAIESTISTNVYPDYAYEFTGRDKFERFNRKIFLFNLKLNKHILRYANIVWASVMPQYGMDRLKNAYNNFNYPTRFIGCLLQKDFTSCKEETIRFLTNTTIGIGGLFDPATTKLKIKQHQEDMAQVLAHYKVRQGPYLVLPGIQGNIRDLAGKLLNCPLRPTAYVGPFGAAINALFAVNNTTYVQSMLSKATDVYADPYDVAKQADGINKYIQLSNLDRDDVYEKKLSSQNLTQVNNLAPACKVSPDRELTNYNSQGALVDSMRTILFENQKIYNSIWSDMSIWNRNFSKKLKISSVNVYPGRAKYRYRYLLQKGKASPLAIIYPSVGSGIMSDAPMVLAKILYDEGYSVIIQGSSFNWEFIKSMPTTYRPGFPEQDANYLRHTTAKIINNIETKKNYKFNNKVLIGSSFGGVVALFATVQDEKEELVGISKCIAINPPVKMFYAMNKVDTFSQDWKNSPSELKDKTALTAEKVIHYYGKINHRELKDMPETTPFNEADAKLIIAFIMKQDLYNAVFAIDNCSRCKKDNLMEKVNKMKFSDYLRIYLSVKDGDDYNKTDYETSLYPIADFLQTSNKYKIYHTVDDFFTNTEQLAWLKQQSKDKSVYFSNGSHLGNLYRKEFIDEFKKEIKSDATTVKQKL